LTRPWLCLLGLGACHVAAGLDGYEFVEPVGTGGQGGEGGTEPACSESSECPLPSPCREAICDAGSCSTAITEGAACGEAGGDECDAEGACRKNDGKGCAVDDECLSAMCVDEVCCAAVCDGLCMRCDLVEQAGTCVAEVAGASCGGAGVCDGTTSELCAAGDHRFSGSWGDGVEQHGFAMTFDSTGRLWIAGLLEGTVDLGDGPQLASGEDAFVLRLDQAGAFSAAYRWTNANFQAIADIAVDARGRALVAGTYSGTTTSFGAGTLVNGGNLSAFFMQLDEAGLVLWEQDFTESNHEQHATHVGILPSADAVLVGGAMRGMLAPLNSATGRFDVFLMRFTTGGIFQWALNWGDDLEDQLLAGLATAADASILLTGGNHGLLDFGNNPMQATGTTWDGFLAKLDSAGNTLWSQQLASPQDVFASDVAVRPDGRVVAVGSFSGDLTVDGVTMSSSSPTEYDGYMIVFSADGDVLAMRGYGDAAGEQAVTAVATDAVGNIALAGRFESQIHFGDTVLSAAAPGDSDMFLAKLAPDTTVLWAKRFGQDPLDDEIHDVAFAPGGALGITGGFRSSANFGGMSFTSQGEGDLFAACFEP
jgi:hypothetical protein